MEITNLIQNLKNILGMEEELLLAYIYGSFLKRGANWHDIDIALLIKKERVGNKLRYALKLSNRLSEYLNIKNVDVRILNDAPLYFQYEVIRTGAPVLIKDEIFRVHYEALVISKWLDFRPLIEEYNKALLQKIGLW